jgi:hypothetical protein
VLREAHRGARAAWELWGGEEAWPAVEACRGKQVCAWEGMALHLVELGQRCLRATLLVRDGHLRRSSMVFLQLSLLARARLIPWTENSDDRGPIQEYDERVAAGRLRNDEHQRGQHEDLMRWDDTD